MSRALFLPPRNAESFVLCSSSRDIRPGSDRHLDQLDKPQRHPANRIEHLLPVIKTHGGDITPKVIMARVPGTAPLQSIVREVIEAKQRSTIEPAVALAKAS